jgi:1-deoxy-D-xylulose-5-phosphate synthase
MGRKSRTVAVVGDASIFNGVAFEGLNQAGTLKRQFLAILNDNSMSIAHTQGALATYLARFRVSSLYEEVKANVRSILEKLPLVGRRMYDLLDHLKEGIKATVSPHQMFEQLGFIYVGPVDGHDIRHLIDLLQILKDVEHPVLLHVHTEKGRGCSWARQDPCAFHSPNKFMIEGDKVTILKSERKSWTTALADAFISIGKTDKRAFALTAAMPDGTGLAKVQTVLPDQVLDCGIAESCTVDIAAGMARSGMKPIACIYSTFLQRAFDQVFQEVVLQKLPVGFCLDRAGFVGGDGAVHHGYLDIAYLRSFQHIVLMAPADEPELEAMMRFGLSLDAPWVVRYPRDTCPTETAGRSPIALGKSWTMRTGPDATILAYGAMVEHALKAAAMLEQDELYVTVVNARFAKPIDSDMVTTAITNGAPVITVEDHSISGGFGTAVLDCANKLGLPTESIIRLGHDPEKFYGPASRSAQFADAGIDAAGISNTVRRACRAARESGTTTPVPIERAPRSKR